MRRGVPFSLGVILGSLAYPLGCLLGQILFNRSVLYPRKA